MKLRQKLAIVLASAMIVTAVPVTTMAASTNSFNKTISVVADSAITTGQGLQLIVDYTDTFTGEDVFYVTAADFEFEEAAYGKRTNGQFTPGTVATPGLEVTFVSKTEVEVKVLAHADKVYVPVAGTPKKGTPSITVDARGSFATSSTLTFGEVTSTKALAVTSGDAKTIAVDVATAELADIKIEEKVAGSIAGQTITVKLPNNSDLNFASAQVVTIEGQRGLGSIATATPNYVDEKTVEIKVPSTVKSERPGTLVVKGLDVVPEDKKADLKTGDVVVTVKGDKLDETKLTVAKVAEYAVQLTVDEVDKMTAGHGTTKVKVKVKEATPGSLGTKPVYLTLDGGKFESIVTAPKKGTAVFTDATKKEEIELTPVAGEGEYEIELEIKAGATVVGDVTIEATGRGLDQDLTVKVAEVAAPFTVETETFNLKTGVRKQKGGKVVITEAAAGKFAKNDEFVIEAEGNYFDIDAAKVEVTEGDAKIKSEVKDGQIIVKIERASDEATEITITDVEVSTSKALADGKYDLVFGGTAVADANGVAGKTKFEDKVKAKDFFVTGDAQEAQQSEVVLVVGNATYTVDGTEKQAEVAPFIDPATSRTMAPVRAVAEAFGCELDFFFPEGSDQLVITMTKGNTTVQFQNGSNVMVVNGGQFIMSATAQIKDGYTFVPVAFLAQALNIEYTWDGATQTIVFGNK